MKTQVSRNNTYSYGINMLHSNFELLLGRLVLRYPDDRCALRLTWPPPSPTLLNLDRHTVFFGHLAFTHRAFIVVSDGGVPFTENGNRQKQTDDIIWYLYNLYIVFWAKTIEPLENKYLVIWVLLHSIFTVFGWNLYIIYSNPKQTENSNLLKLWG